MGKMITASMMKKFMLHPSVSLYSYFKYSSLDLQMATYDEMVSGDGLFNMIETHPDNVIALFDGMIAGETDVDIQEKLIALKSICIAYSNPEPEPIIEPESVITTEKSINWTQGQTIVVTINTDLSKQRAATAWLVEDGFEPEFTKCGVMVKSANKYRLRVKNIKSGTITVRIPEQADFDLEVE